MIAADTSLAVAAALPWHLDHAAARDAMSGADLRLIGHVAIETYSVLTRLPPPQRVGGPVALAFIRAGFRPPFLVLSAAGYTDLVAQVAVSGIAGGRVYDALIAAVAREAGATLLTLDRRAVGTYEAMGAAYRLVH